MSNDGSGHLAIQDSTLSNNRAAKFESPGYPGIFWLTNSKPQVTSSTIQ